MTLSRTPLRASKEHEVELTDTSGTWGQYRCTRCGDSRSELIPKVESGERDPLPWPCTGLKRSGLQRNKRVNPVSERREEKRPDLNTGLEDYVEGLPCLLSCRFGHRCEGDVVAHHVRHKNHAGDWVERDGERVGNLTPLCAVGGHQDGPESVHVMGRDSFEEHWDVDLEREAREIGESYQQEEAG